MENTTYMENTIGEAALPTHELFAVFDRKVDALPIEKRAIEIFKDGEWLACEWSPRTSETQADAGYLGTAMTTARPIQIGFHAWEQNDSEFRHFCLPANAPKRMAEEIDTLIPRDEAVDPHPLVSGRSFHDLQKLIFALERRLDPQSAAVEQLREARESIGLARRAFEFAAANV